MTIEVGNNLEAGLGREMVDCNNSVGRSVRIDGGLVYRKDEREVDYEKKPKLRS